MNARDFLQHRVRLFQKLSAERLEQLVDGSRVVSFEANEAIAHQGAEATHFGVVLSGTVAASVAGDGGVRQPSDSAAVRCAALFGIIGCRLCGSPPGAWFHSC
jgi:signal-transduction protein with cAMP-binding, CBS, and nucleotidyltransferase domain